MTSLPEGDGLSLNLVGVLGATSSVGACLLPMLTEAGWQVTAFSRSAVEQSGDRVAWRRLAPSSPAPLMESLVIRSGHQTVITQSSGLPRAGEESISFWICVAPIWVLPDYFALLDAQGARRVVVMSSTSRFTKDDSTDPEEQAIALRLADAEARVREWAESRGVEWVILRPTLIYGLGRDKNICRDCALHPAVWLFSLVWRGKRPTPAYSRSGCGRRMSGRFAGALCGEQGV